MFLTSIGAVIAVLGSAIVLGAIAVRSLLRIFARKPGSPPRTAVQVGAYRMRSPAGEIQRVA